MQRNIGSLFSTILLAAVVGGCDTDPSATSTNGARISVASMGEEGLYDIEVEAVCNVRTQVTNLDAVPRPERAIRDEDERAHPATERHELRLAIPDAPVNGIEVRVATRLDAARPIPAIQEFQP